MNKFFKKIAILLCVIFIAPTVLNCLPSVQTVTRAEAAAKVKVGFTNKTLGIYSTPEYLYIQNGKSNATYTYASSNKKIATIDKNGKITGISNGKANITVTETYKGKKTKVSTTAVSVVNSKLAGKTLEIQAYSGWLPPIQYKNFKAAYTLVPADPTILKVDKNGFLIGLKEGKTTVSITETYKKVKRDLGSITVTVTQSYISDEYKNTDIGLNTSYNAYDKLNVANRSWSAVYSYEAADSNIVSFNTVTDEWGYETTSITGKGLGTTTVTVYEEYDGLKRTVGTIEVTVKEIAATALKINSWYAEADGTMAITYYLGDKNDNALKKYLSKEPVDASTPITFASSDEAVVKVNNDGVVEAISEGTAVITATCGSFTAVFNITVSSY